LLRKYGSSSSSLRMSKTLSEALSSVAP